MRPPRDEAIHLTARGEPEGRSPLERDRNGRPIERRVVGGIEVVVHFDSDIPESDLTIVDGIPCTTAVRTLVDIAPELCAADLDHAIQDALARRLFSLEELSARCTAPDLAGALGARLIRRSLVRLRLPHSADRR